MPGTAPVHWHYASLNPVVLLVKSNTYNFACMTINFLLPGASHIPVGGVKVVLEYANKMAADGHKVNLMYPVTLKKEDTKPLNLYQTIRFAKKRFQKRRAKHFTCTTWFPLHPTVRERFIPFLAEKYVPDADISFATARVTAEWLNSYSAKKGKKMYLIQHFEDWDGTKEEVEKTWVMPLKKIVISRWLQDYAANLGQPSWLVNNGLDFEAYGITAPIAGRNPMRCIMLYHQLQWKGSADGLAAMQIVKEKFPAASLILFGVYDKPAGLPDWVEYHQKPFHLKALYNEAAIFVSPSWGEGWALPPAEAMQCGCAAVVTDIGGHRDYGVDGKDLLLAPVKDPAGLAKAIISLLEDNSRRIAIATSGNATIQQFTWEAAYQKLKAAF
jgi:glycosyltransferase involved in cell wall biosynthesis